MFAAALKKTFFSVTKLGSISAQRRKNRVFDSWAAKTYRQLQYNGQISRANRSIIKSKRGGEGMVHKNLVDAGGRNIVD